MALEARLGTEMRTLPGVLQTLGMLTMTHQEVLEAAERCLADNPVLERVDGHPCPGCGRHVTGGICHRCRSHGVSRELHDEVEAGVDPFLTIEAEAGMEVRPDCRHALVLVIAHLTSRGLLDADEAEIACLHGLTAGQVREAVRALRSVGPPGIAATDVASLLTAQAEALVDAQQAPAWLPRLVHHHLQDLAAGRFAQVAQAMAIPMEDVEGALVIIRSRLRPFAVVETAPTNTAVPGADVFLYRNTDGSVEVEVPTSVWLGLKVVDFSARLGAAPEARQWWAQHEAEARRLVRQVDGRANVLLRVARLAVARQRGFLEHGPGQHQTLTRTAVAQELGVHPSTVSRAVGGKRLRLPGGEVVDLACLFGKGVAARAALEELLAPAGVRSSDTVLRDELARRGIVVARRTVTKYRHTLVPPR